ncbi:ABC transporter ATP-binding protein [Halorarum halobium]|uniref:ABC transporter ATP-binding protein n=1 Tax=Halorarum halobium TaxID=3075121 RepID=UPI0028AC132A|nr:ABC transporter ATP-binding protein [Halobaculum sp. XH14]
MAPIEVTDLTKDYGSVVGIDSLTFSVEEGEVFGFLGPNGAGKTTTIRTILGFQSPTSGTATILGRDVEDEGEFLRAKADVGYLPATPVFDETATGTEILDLHADIKGGSRREELLERFDPPVDRPVREYSTGNVQKLAIVQAFMHDPDLVVMDEPTSGLDPLMQQRFNDYIHEEQRRGVTVFFSSHVLSEVRRLCNRVAILRDGHLIATEPVESLLHRSGKVVHLRIDGTVDETAFDIEGVHDLDVRSTVGAQTGNPPQEESDHDLKLRADESDGTGTVTDVSFTFTGDVNDLVDAVAPYELREFDVEEAPLDEVFMQFYGGEASA